VLPVGCWWSQWAVMAAHHCYFWWWWWSDALWVTLIRWWLHSMLSYLQCVVEISLQSHKNNVLPGWCAKGWGQVIWSCKLSLHVHGENYILFELVFGFILIVDIHLNLPASLSIFFSSGNRVVKYFELCWWCCCLQQRWKEKFVVMALSMASTMILTAGLYDSILVPKRKFLWISRLTIYCNHVSGDIIWRAFF
jgi:hypothetical protein